MCTNVGAGKLFGVYPIYYIGLDLPLVDTLHRLAYIQDLFVGMTLICLPQQVIKRLEKPLILSL
jgi:hypothetical protein